MKKIRKVAIFSPNTVSTKVIERNGISLDDICYSCTVDEDISTGSYFLDGTFLIDKDRQLYKKIKEESIIKVALDYGDEIFKINYVKRNTRTITIVARQITIPATLSLWLHDVKSTNTSGLVTLDHLLKSSIGKKEISIFSNIQKTGNVEYKKKNLYEALHTIKDSFGDIYGGEVQRRGYQLNILNKIGTDRGLTIRSRKNLQGYEDTIDIDKLCTRGIGEGYGGIEGDYLDSSKINDYADIYTRTFTYSDIKVKGEHSEEGFDTLEEAKVEINKRVSNEFIINKVDELKAQYKLSFLELEKTEEGKEFTPATKVYPGDTVTVYQDTLDVKIKVRAIRRKFNIMTQKVIETELSNLPLSSYQKPPTISDILDKLDKIEDNNSNFLELAKDNATALINAGLKNSYVIVRANEIIIGDTKDINTMTKLYRWNVNGLAHSKTGYYGKYDQAMTSDGAIVADFITTGILNANLIRAGTIKSFDGKTWLNLDDNTFNLHDFIKFDGKIFSIDTNAVKTSFNSINASVEISDTGLLIRNGMFTIMDAFNKKIFGTDLKGNISYSGRLQPNDYTLRLFGDECLLDGSANALRRVFAKGIYDSVDSAGCWRLFNQYSNNGTRYASIGYESDGHLSIYNNSSRLKMLYGTAWLQARNTGDNSFCPITSSNFDVSSKREFKTNITDPTINFKNILMDSKIEQYNYKSDVAILQKTKSLENPDIQIGLILEDLTEEAREVLHTKGGAGISLYTMISVLWKTCQDQELRIDKLEKKLLEQS